ncbi:MAG: transporter substrate-binding domain-containing protein [Marinobacterium sp.]|nr:transporter substrate-binding domain-containing protein [Marinobacterium sp.]
MRLYRLMIAACIDHLRSPMLYSLLLISPLLVAQPLLPLEQRSSIRFCVDPQWMPFERINRNGEYEGIIADFMQEFARQLPIPLQLVKTQSWAETLHKAQSRDCDLIPAMNSSEERLRHFNFTSPYLESAVVIITRSDAGYMDGFNALRGKRLGVVSGYIYDELLEDDYPDIQRVYTNSVRDAFRQVASGKLDATIASLLSATQLIQEQGLTNLKIAGDTGFSHQLRVAIRKDDPVLTDTFEQLVQALPETSRNKILQRWYTVRLQQAPDYTLLYQLAALATLLLGLLYYRSRRISLTSNQLGQLNSRLNDRNARLERLSQHDPLTGARTRLQISHELQQRFNQSQHRGQSLSLLLLDICQFHQINRQHGTTIGDLVLSEVCQLIQELQPTDAMLGRWSGDQFIMLVPGKHTEQTLLLPLQRRLEQHSFSGGVKLQMQLSLAQPRVGEPLQELLFRLEKALRNRTSEHE